MQSFKIAPVIVSILLLATTSQAYGQTVTYSLLGHERQIGPLEQCLYYNHEPSYERIIFLHCTAQPDSVIYQPHIVQPVIGGIIGGAVGIGLAYLIGSNCEGPSPVVIAGLIIEPFFMAYGTHVGNRELGSFWLDWLSAAGSLIGGSILCDTVWEDLGGEMIVPFVLQLAATLTVEKMVGDTKAPKKYWRP